MLLKRKEENGVVSYLDVKTKKLYNQNSKNDFGNSLSGMKGVGFTFSMIGVLGVFIGFFMETSTKSDSFSLSELIKEQSTPLYNIGLLNIQQNVIIVSSALLLAGLIIYQLGVFLTEYLNKSDQIIASLTSTIEQKEDDEN